MTRSQSFSLVRLMRARLRAFAEETRGSVTVEAAIMLPLLVWAYTALYSFFDAYRQTSINHKAAYTISDMISREAQINDSYLDGAFSMMSFLTRNTTDRKLRVTYVRYDGDEDEYIVQWSEARGGATAMAEGEANDMRARLPVMVDEERLILVETWASYTAPFRIVNLTNQVIDTFVFTRPRFGQQVCWDECGA